MQPLGMIPAHPRVINLAKKLSGRSLAPGDTALGCSCSMATLGKHQAARQHCSKQHQDTLVCLHTP